MTRHEPTPWFGWGGENPLTASSEAQRSSEAARRKELVAVVPFRA